MGSAAFMTKLSRRWRGFSAAESGNFAVIFAVSAFPMVALVGAAVDYSQANAMRSRMQTAADSAALAVSKDAAAQTAAQVQSATQAHFNALFNDANAQNVQVSGAYSKNPDSQVKVNATAAYKTTLLNMWPFNIAEMPISVASTTKWGNIRLRVALALDNTGSMASSGKMGALKTASKNLIDQLKIAAVNTGDVYVSIVPFAKDVNVGGPTSYTKDWVRWEGWGNGDDTWNDLNGTCAGASKNNRKKCENSGGTWTPADHATWNGCVTDRDQNFDVDKTAPNVANGATLFPAEQYSSCPVELTPLSYDWNLLKGKIDTMAPAGNTNITIGLQWGWLSLLQQSPLNAPAEDPKYQYQKVIILLTDGENTQNRFTSSSAQIDDRTRAACTAAKAAGVTIYTILVMEGNQNLLQQCASDSSKYFYLTSANQIITAFNTIGTSLSRLRVAK